MIDRRCNGCASFRNECEGANLWTDDIDEDLKCYTPIEDDPIMKTALDGFQEYSETEKKNDMPKLVTWKDEGVTGPCTIYNDPREFGKMRNFGEPIPESVEPIGVWVTRIEAQKIATSLGCEFREL